MLSKKGFCGDLRATLIQDQKSMRNLESYDFCFPPTAREGALIGYGPDYQDLYRRAASYVERLLKGTKPADLPVEQPTKFELVITIRHVRSPVDIG